MHHDGKSVDTHACGALDRHTTAAHPIFAGLGQQGLEHLLAPPWIIRFAARAALATWTMVLPMSSELD